MTTKKNQIIQRNDKTMKVIETDKVVENGLN